MALDFNLQNYPTAGRSDEVHLEGGRLIVEGVLGLGLRALFFFFFSLLFYLLFASSSLSYQLITRSVQVRTSGCCYFCFGDGVSSGCYQLT